MAIKVRKVKTKNGLENYSITITAMQGLGKTTMAYNLIKLIEESTGVEGAGVLLPLEYGYKAIDEVPVLTMEDPRTKKFKNTIDSYAELDAIIKMIVKEKQNDPLDPLRIVVIDTSTQLEGYIKAEIEKRWFDQTGERKTFNGTFGSYGKPNDVMKEILREEIIKRLQKVGVECWFIAHSKQKVERKEDIENEYTVMTADGTDSFYKVIYQACDIAMVLYKDKKFQTITVGSDVKTQKVMNKVVDETRFARFEANGYYQNAKCRFNGVPDIIELPNTPEGAAKLVYDVLNQGMKNGMKAETLQNLESITLTQHNDMINEIKDNATAILESENDIEIFEKRDKILKFIESASQSNPSGWSNVKSQWIEAVEKGNLEALSEIEKALIPSGYVS